MKLNMQSNGHLLQINYNFEFKKTEAIISID